MSSLIIFFLLYHIIGFCWQIFSGFVGRSEGWWSNDPDSSPRICRNQDVPFEEGDDDCTEPRRLCRCILEHFGPGITDFGILVPQNSGFLLFSSLFIVFARPFKTHYLTIYHWCVLDVFWRVGQILGTWSHITVLHDIFGCIPQKISPSREQISIIKSDFLLISCLF